MKHPSYREPSPEDSTKSEHTPSEEADDYEVEEEIEEEMEEEFEEDVPVVEDPVTRPAKLGVRRKARGLSSTSGARDDDDTDDAPPEHPVCISGEPVFDPDRVMVDYSKVTLDAYRKIRRTNQFDAPPNCLDPRFRTNVQADVFSSVAARQKLADSHACIPLEFIQTNPEKFPGVMELVDSVGLGSIFGFRHDWNTTAILQFYATVFFHTSNRQISWMTGEQECTTTFAQFQKALGMRASGVRIHASSQKEKAKTQNDCLCFVKPGLEGDASRWRPNCIHLAAALPVPLSMCLSDVVSQVWG